LYYGGDAGFWYLRDGHHLILLFGDHLGAAAYCCCGARGALVELPSL
jgi:hypothetical protein